MMPYSREVLLWFSVYQSYKNFRLKLMGGDLYGTSWSVCIVQVWTSHSIASFFRTSVWESVNCNCVHGEC
jgi:hypothetical protein